MRTSLLLAAIVMLLLGQALANNGMTFAGISALAVGLLIVLVVIALDRRTS